MRNDLPQWDQYDQLLKGVIAFWHNAVSKPPCLTMSVKIMGNGNSHNVTSIFILH
jgi:hypothetical protein